MKKKVFYKETRQKVFMVEVETQEQENLVIELNKETDRFEKSESTYQARHTSLEKMVEEKGYMPISQESSPEEKCIEDESKQIMQERIKQAMELLTDRQKEVVYKTFWEDKTLREIGKELGITHVTAHEILESAKKKIKKFLKNF